MRLSINPSVYVNNQKLISESDFTQQSSPSNQLGSSLTLSLKLGSGE